MKTCKLRVNYLNITLSNLSVGQEVTFTSKVYQDKSWTGKISYISDYPKNNGEAASTAAAAAGGNSGSKYPYTIDVTSEIGDLKQGFSVSVEVKNKSKAILVPLTSVVTEMIRTMSGCLTSRKRPRKWKLVWAMLMQTTKKSLQV